MHHSNNEKARASKSDLLHALHELDQIDIEIHPRGSPDDRKLRIKKKLLARTVQKEIGKIKTFSW